jgi:hypothetical protein
MSFRQAIDTPFPENSKHRDFKRSDSKSMEPMSICVLECPDVDRSVRKILVSSRITAASRPRL